MSTGIYKLTFNGTDKVYIGLSINIDVRYKQHLYNLENNYASKKLQSAYNLYGTPSIVVLEECEVSALSGKELEYISKYDSIHNGFNTAIGGLGNAPGEINPSSKYSNSLIEEIFLYINDNPDKSIRSIAEKYDIPYNTLYDVVSGKGHVWLKSLHPDTYQKIVSKTGSRVSNNKGLSAKDRGIVYPKLRSPDGRVHEISCFKDFLDEHKLIGNSVRRLMSGTTKIHKGWSVAREN